MKIYYNLDETPYHYDGTYGTTYFFSTRDKAKRFARLIGAEVKRVNDMMTARYRQPVDITTLIELKLYREIEQRGFVVYKDGKQIEDKTEFKIEMQ